MVLDDTHTYNIVNACANSKRPAYETTCGTKIAKIFGTEWYIKFMKVYTALLWQKTVSAYLQSKRILHFAFARQ